MEDTNEPEKPEPYDEQTWKKMRGKHTWAQYQGVQLVTSGTRKGQVSSSCAYAHMYHVQLSSWRWMALLVCGLQSS